MFIYMIVNHVTGKYYVGQHKGANLRQYLQQKFYEARKRLSAKSHLYASIRKHGRDAFSIHALLSDVQTKSELDQHEKDFIAFLRARDPEFGYNICKGGEGYTGPLTEKMKNAWRAGNLKHWDNLNNLVGKTFGRLTVTSKAEQRKSGVGRKGRRLWNCQCSCGNTSVVPTSALKSGAIKSCGCLISEAATRRVGGSDLTGMRFGRLNVEGDSGRCPRSQKLWRCKCECGEVVFVRTSALNSGRQRSCGCLKDKNKTLRLEACRLRDEGLRLTDIAKQLNIPVPTCHGWIHR
jgi:hypothetical protein